MKIHRTPRAPRAIGAALLLAATLAGGARAANAPSLAGATLEKTVLIARHGVRSPTRPPKELKAQTGRDWPAWPVPPGQLTPHGRAALAAMADALGARYRQLDLLPTAGCPAPGTIAIWADSADDRTRQSGAIMAATLAPRCGLAAHALPAGQADLFFNALGTGAATLDQARVTAALAHAIAQDRDHRPKPVQDALARLQALVAPDGCAQTHDLCLTEKLSLSWQHGAPHLKGGPVQAATIAENMMLAYAQGMGPQQVAWGAPDDATLLATILPAHLYAATLTRRLPAIAIPRASVLSRAIIDLLADRPVTLPDHSAIGPDARLVLFAGHDTTLDMLAATFGLDWAFADQPDPTAPDTTLAFERWRLKDGSRVVRAVILHQGLEQLRAARKPDLSGTGATTLPIGTCAGATLCPLGHLRPATIF
ncbi:histidine-type phosphatase [Gluconacetobacter takamatsuzukensis]|uniref:Histidine-type phosphatase n=1 Tax=Gluconacetobacter takamatsuzukensis TaxID=1286190 RepID=A0A7W4PMR3_9PROT|nr:histidine-type phosphatase [Gluconacetobacter takamatsuzukensis]MBB2203470.1 histidine-type phosphatase [Gluconacetobacter takamatsuzukensis]